MPSWVTLLLALFLVFHFDVYYEAILAGFILDSMYSVSTEVFNNFQLIYTTILLFLFGVSIPLKKVLRSYHK